MENKFNRPQITIKEIVAGIKTLEVELNKEIEAKGSHAFISTHEIIGVIQEEFDELKEAIRSNNYDNIDEELKDLMVSVLWGYISFYNRKCDW